MRTVQKNTEFKNYRQDIPACEPFPYEGKVRARQIAKFLGIGLSTWWLYLKLKRVSPPLRLSPRISVWDASYIRELAENGIPEAPNTEN